MKTSRPVDARLLADGEDPGLQSELGDEYTRLYGGCHEHAARDDPVYRIGEGPGLTIDLCKAYSKLMPKSPSYFIYIS